MSKQKELLDKLLESSEIINKSSRKGQGNFFVINTGVINNSFYNEHFRLSKIKKILKNINYYVHK